MKTLSTILGLGMLCLIFSCSKDITSTPNTDQQISQLDFTKGISSHIPEEFRIGYSNEELNELDELAKGNFTYGLTLRSGAEIIIEAGSVNGLATAMEQADEGDKIIFQSGMHTQEGTALVNKRVHIYGEEGATIECSGFPLSTAFPVSATSAIQIEDADHTIIQGLHLTTTEASHPSAILILNSEKVRIIKNMLDNFQFGITIQNGSKAKIYFNTLNINPTWATGAIPDAEGILCVNGNFISIVGNNISGSVLGIFTGGIGGISMGNTTNGNLYGQILCRVPPGLMLPNGDVVGAEISTKRWLVKHNTANENFAAGYLVIDGANQSLLVSNRASDNALYDIELAGVSQRFGFETPACFNNRVYATRDLIIKDCGDDNRVLGGVLIDNSEDECF